MLEEKPSSTKAEIDKYTAIALVVSLLLYPLLYSTDFFSSLIFPLLSENVIATYFDETNRVRWWVFWLTNMPYHWIPFFFIWFALYKNKENWASIGLNLQWVVKHKYWFICLLVFLLAAAFFLPGVYYGGEIPQNSSAGWYGPITTAERLFVIFMSFTAAVTEEVMFRGFAFTRLTKWIKNPWFILPITAISFLLIHGEPDNIGRMATYLLAACAFAIPFILFGLKRLELIILIHFCLDASMVLVP